VQSQVLFILGALFSIGAVSCVIPLLRVRRVIKRGIPITAMIKINVERNKKYFLLHINLESDVKAHHAVYEWTIDSVKYKQQCVLGYDKPKYAKGDKIEAYYTHDAPNKIVTKAYEKAYRNGFIAFASAGIIFVLVGCIL